MQSARRLFFALVFFIPLTVSALSLSEVSYPIEELGDCSSRESCEVFCDDIKQIGACVIWADKVGLEPTPSSSELLKKKNIIEMSLQEFGGPGGCLDGFSCDVYCQDIAHALECFSFSRDAGFVPFEKIGFIEQMLPFVLNGLSSGVGPGGCTTITECALYCDEQDNLDVCLRFTARSPLSESTSTSFDAWSDELMSNAAPLPDVARELDFLKNDFFNFDIALPDIMYPLPMEGVEPAGGTME